ncbi:uncharacterized protein LOC143046676 [Mytilus galloprovincialis]|uniref:uncharacterized protein LOC143046676 n=1 Tax=Mytilus galloprovincialis TaxID=29158 RepID=UPI003F7B4AD1
MVSIKLITYGVFVLLITVDDAYSEENTTINTSTEVQTTTMTSETTPMRGETTTVRDETTTVSSETTATDKTTENTADATTMTDKATTIAAVITTMVKETTTTETASLSLTASESPINTVQIDIGTTTEQTAITSGDDATISNKMNSNIESSLGSGSEESTNTFYSPFLSVVMSVILTRFHFL